MTYRVYLVPPSEVSEYWPEAIDLLRPAIEQSGGRMTEKDVLHDIITGVEHLWIIFEDEAVVAACSTTINVYPSKRVLNVLFLGGDGFNNWVGELDQKLSEFCLFVNCSAMELIGRRGFKRAVQQLGWTEEYTLFQKEIDHGERLQGPEHNDDP